MPLPQVGVVFSPYKLVGKGAFGLDMILRQWLLQFAVERMYVQIDKDIGQLDAFEKRTFLKRKENFAYFLVFYRTPSVSGFLRFFRKSPLWALASLASLVINFVKFEHLKPK